MRALALGLLAFLFVTLTVLSLRPGGLRSQLRNAARRLRIALLLAGVYLAASLGFRLLVPSPAWEQWMAAGLGLVLGLVFLVLAQEPRTGA